MGGEQGMPACNIVAREMEGCFEDEFVQRKAADGREHKTDIDIPADFAGPVRLSWRVDRETSRTLAYFPA